MTSRGITPEDPRYGDAHVALAAGVISKREFNRITKSLLTSSRGRRKVSPSTPINKEPIMARTSSTSKSTARPAAKATPKAKAPAKAKAPVVTAASVARDAGLDPFKFRVFLRSNGIGRDARSLRAAVKKFKADTK